PVAHLFRTRGGDPHLHHAAAEHGRDSDLRGSAGPALALDRAAHLGPRHRHVRHALARYAVRLCLLQPSDRWFPPRLARRRAVRARGILRRRVVARDHVRALISGDQSADRGEAGAAPRCRPGLTPDNGNEWMAAGLLPTRKLAEAVDRETTVDQLYAYQRRFYRSGLRRPRGHAGTGCKIVPISPD